MFREDGGRPNDRRGFLHKSFIGKIVGDVVTSVIPVVGGIKTGIEAVRGIIGGGGGAIPGGGGGFVPATQAQLALKDCPFGSRLNNQGVCVQTLIGPTNGGAKTCDQLRRGDTADQAEWQRRCGRAGERQDFGAATMGQFGAGLEPMVIDTMFRRCPRGAVLGKDGLCYNRTAIKNVDRLWPMGTKPLLTGGEMRCIRIASRASNKLQRKEKQLRAMGMLPALPRRSSRKALPAGHHAHVAHN